MTGIYIHIPFCVKKCLYCDFVSACGTQEEMRLYKDALIQEIAQTEIPEEIDSIFIGGGTPSVIPVSYIEEILRNIYAKYSISMQAEISIEANPGTLTKEKLDIYRKSGVNRISIGLQTADDEELKNLGRIYRYQEFSEAYEMARDAGFQNINVDLMSAIPGQNMKSYQETIEKVFIQKRFLQNMDMRDMKFPTMQEKDMSADTISNTGAEKIIMDLESQQHLLSIIRDIPISVTGRNISHV